MTKDELKIVFLGTPDFAVESLDRLVTEGYCVAAVVTMPDKVAGRGHKLIQSAVKQYAVAHNLPVLQPEKLKNPEFLNQLEAINADLFIVIAFRMLPEVVWRMPRLGTFNLHASLLPRYRGAAPINWSIINGDHETGVTTFFLKHDIDTGDILLQEKIPINFKDNAETLHYKLMHLGADVTVATVDGILNGTLVPKPQEKLLDNCEATPAPKIFRDTCHINWNLTEKQIIDFVRGLSPYPAAWSTLLHRGKRIEMKILETDFSSLATGIAPGSIWVENGHMYVGTGSAPIEILKVKPEGKKAMSAQEFMRGTNVSDDTFEM